MSLPQMGPLITSEHREKVFGYITLGKQEGATVAAGGEKLSVEGNYLQPTLFSKVQNDMRIAREEIFVRNSVNSSD